ncbi:MAG: phenylacetate--CoA ligase family protein [Candidatus Sericytochromatia bacterium]|nr:phenylacetate--CoA ligase family protein [Candidatus Tanganyikabacteria bacterium]
MSIRMRAYDLLSGRSSWRCYQTYLKTQWFSPAQMKEFQVAKLRRLLYHCQAHVPFYAQVLAENRIDPATVDSPEVLQAFPILDKSRVRAAYKRFVTDNLGRLPKVRVGQTGGTTGEPLRFYQDSDAQSSMQGAIFRFNDWMGVDYSAPKITVWGGRVADDTWLKRLKKRTRCLLERDEPIDAFRIRPGRFEELKDVFERVKPQLLQGYCLSIYELARLFDEHGYHPRLAALVTTVEPLFDEYRPLFRKVFGCEAFDQYGSSEIKSIAFECDHHKGLHVCWERVWAEVEPDGTLILTDLDNLAFPFIRYKLGDQVRLAAETCACGRRGPVFEKILGRVGNVVIGLDGNRLHPEYFTHLINETAISYNRNVRRYQVVQRSRDELVWQFVADPLTPEDKETLTGYLRDYLGAMAITIANVPEIPTAPSGKFQYVVSELGEVTTTSQ